VSGSASYDGKTVARAAIRVSALAFVLALAVVGEVHAQPAPSASPLAEESLASDFGKSAEEVAARLRSLSRSLLDGAAIAALEAEVALYTRRAASHWDETERLLARNLRTTALDSVNASWTALHADLEDLDERIAARVRHREAELASLVALHASWTHALDVGRTDGAPAAVLDRLQSTVAAIEATQPQLEQRRAALLVLQDAVSRASQHCDDAEARVADARLEAIGRALTPQEPPIWSDAPADTPLAAPADTHGTLAARLENVAMYARGYRGRLAATLLVVAVLAVALRRARRRLADLASEDGSAVARHALRAPIAAAILIGMMVTVPLRPTPPYELQQAMLALVLAASAFVFRPLVDARLATAVYVAWTLFVVNVISQTLEPEPRAEQLLLIVEMSVMAGLLLWAMRWLASGHAAASSVRSVLRALALVLAIACALSAVAAALGYLDLADFLGIGLLSGLLLAVGLLAVRTVLGDLIALALARGPVSRLRTVARHRALIRRRARTTLDACLVLLWIWAVLGRFELREPLREGLSALLDTSLRAGGLEIPVEHLLAFVVVVVVVLVGTRLLGTVLEEDVYARMRLPRGVPYALSTLTRYALLLVGFLVALGALGLDLTRITVLVSALGLGLGFGLQQIMNNFVSGLILLFERPVQVGDSIQMDALSGEVRRIGIRSSTVRTGQGAEVIVPNAKLLEEKVVNWTLTDRKRRFDLDLSVGGEVDVERVMALIVEVAREHTGVSSSPPPEALLVRLGRKATHFQLRFWTDDAHWMRVWSELSVRLHRSLGAVRTGDAPGTGSRRA